MTVVELRDAVRIDVAARWHRFWPPTALAVVLLIDAAWVALLSYGLVKLF